MKKLVALSLSVVMIFSLVIVNTSATENSSNIPFIEEYALNFMRTSQNDDDIELLTVKEMYDLDDNITGYYVLFQKDATPAGYVLISMLVEGNPVVDFALEGAGIFESNNNALLGKAQAKLVYTGPDCIFFDNGTNFLYSVMDRTSVNKTAVEKNYQQYIKSIDRATVLSPIYAFLIRRQIFPDLRIIHGADPHIIGPLRLPFQIVDLCRPPLVTGTVIGEKLLLFFLHENLIDRQCPAKAHCIRVIQGDLQNAIFYCASCKTAVSASIGSVPARTDLDRHILAGNRKHFFSRRQILHFQQTAFFHFCTASLFTKSMSYHTSGRIFSPSTSTTAI